MEKDLFDFDYSLYLEHLAICQNNTIRCVAEAVCISEGQIDELISVNESFIDGIKNIINKIIETIKKQFAKFTETMSAIFTTESVWLRKAEVKDTILNRPWKEREPFEMTVYHEENFDKFLIKPFDFNNFKQVTTAENVEAEFIKSYFKDTGDIIKSDGGEIKAQVKQAIMGDAEEIRITSLNKTNMYNFCINWEETSKKLNNDIARINEGRDKLARELGAYSRDIESQLNNKETKDTKDTPSSETDEKEVGKITKIATMGTSDEEIKTRHEKDVKESCYSLLYDNFVTEAIGKPGKPIETKTQSTTAAAPAAKSTIKTGTIDLNNKVAGDSVNAYKGGENEEKLAEVKKMQDNTSQYFTFLGNIIMAKLEAAQSMYKDYIKLLRMHVKDYAGESGETNKDNSTPSEQKKPKDIPAASGKINGSEASIKGEFCYTTKTGTKYWAPASKLGIVLKAGNNIENDSLVKNLSKYQKAAKFPIEATAVNISSVKVDGKTSDYAVYNNGAWKFAEVVKDEGDKIFHQAFEETDTDYL